MIYDTSVLVVKYEQILGLFAIFFTRVSWMRKPTFSNTTKKYQLYRPSKIKERKFVNSTSHFQRTLSTWFVEK